MKQFEYCAYKKTLSGEDVSEKEFSNFTCNSLLKDMWPQIEPELDKISKIKRYFPPERSQFEQDWAYTPHIHLVSPAFSVAPPAATFAAGRTASSEQKSESSLLPVGPSTDGQTEASPLPLPESVLRSLAPPMSMWRFEATPSSPLQPASTSGWWKWPPRERDLSAFCLLVATIIGLALLALFILQMERLQVPSGT